MNEFMQLSDFIMIVDNALTKEFCEHVIEKFESDEFKSDGVVGGGLHKDIKNTKDLHITSFSHWKEEDEIFNKNIEKYLKEYLKYIEKFSDCFHISDSNYIDTGYQIQKYNTDCGYTWHQDDIRDKFNGRYFTFIWYLNDVYEDGYTEFCDGTRVRPKQGRLIFFPSTWTFLHRGYPPKNQCKYICTGWIYLNI